MSWVAGQIVINDTSKKSMDEAFQFLIGTVLPLWHLIELTASLCFNSL